MSGTINSQDQSFITTTAQDSLSEITDGRIAEQQSGDLGVSIYGRQLATDHAFITQQTYAAALQGGATVATTPDATQQAQTAQLAGLTGTAFDQQYLSNEVQSNATSATDGQTEIASGQNLAVRTFATLLAPFQAQHLLQAQTLQAAENGTAPPASTPPTASPSLPVAPNGAPNAQDLAFIQQAANSNIMEIQASQLAEAQSGDVAVDTYARWLVLDHTVLNAGLQQAAQAEGVTPPSTPNATQAAMIAQLQGLTGTAFIQQYLSDEVSGHTQTVYDLEREINNGADPALVAQAQAALPVVVQHLAAAVQASTVLNAGLNDQTGAPSTAAGQAAVSLGNQVAQAAVTIGQELATAGTASSASLFPPTPGAGASSLGTLTSPTGSSAPTSGFAVTDTATGATTQAAGSGYSGPVSYLQTQYSSSTPDGVNVIAQGPNVFITSGAGNDALVANSGSNVLDGGTGSNFLVGASGADGGTDTFFVNTSGGQSTWDTLVNFHVGDTLTLWGYTGASSSVSFTDNQGAAGYQGATLDANLGNGNTALVTFAGLTNEAARLATTTGTSGGLAYLAVTRTA